MTTKAVYLYDAVTNEFKGEYAAHPSPVEPGKFIEPTFSTEIAPPTAGANEVPVFALGAWSLQPDYRGQTIYDQSSGAPQEVTVIGAIPAGFALTPPPPTIDQARISANNLIDAAAGEARAKYITTVAGQSETYMAKAADAAAYKAAGYPFASIANYPWIQAEAVAINGASPTAVQVQAAADLILSAQLSWIALGAKIEQARRAGSVAVGQAMTVAAVMTAKDAAVAALGAI